MKPQRLRCYFGVHCYHYNGKKNKIVEHGKRFGKKVTKENEYACCYCPKNTFDPAPLGPMLFFGSIEWHRRSKNGATMGVSS